MSGSPITLVAALVALLGGLTSSPIPLTSKALDLFDQPVAVGFKAPELDCSGWSR